MQEADLALNDEPDRESKGEAEQAAEYEADLQERLYGKKSERAYTLTIISDPEQSGIESNFKDYSRWVMDQRGILK